LTLISGSRSIKARNVGSGQGQGILPDMGVLHKCDVPLCVNPKHLWLGTKKDNALDMSAKGRATTPFAKLTEQQVREIRARRKNGEKGVSLAKEYGLCTSQIAGINTGRYWKHVI
jgi:hypothetical protein